MIKIRIRKLLLKNKPRQRRKLVKIKTNQGEGPLISVAHHFKNFKLRRNRLTIKKWISTLTLPH